MSNDLRFEKKVECDEGFYIKTRKGGEIHLSATDDGNDVIVSIVGSQKRYKAEIHTGEINEIKKR